MYDVAWVEFYSDIASINWSLQIKSITIPIYRSVVII